LQNNMFQPRGKCDETLIDMPHFRWQTVIVLSSKAA